MIEPASVDIGRKVIYVSNRGKREDGVITSFSDSFVFVRYGNDGQGIATLREDLEWLSNNRDR